MRRSTRLLVWTNSILLACAGGLVFLPRAFAQSGGSANAPSNPTANAANRPKGNYLMVGGKLLGGDPVIYITDSTNQEILALRWDQGAGRLEAMAFRSLTQDAQNVRLGR